MRGTRYRLFSLFAAAAAALAFARSHAPGGANAGDALDRCTTAELAGRLAPRLPHLRVLASDVGGRFAGGFYLTRSPDQGFRELELLRREPGPHWRGAVFCRRQFSGESLQPLPWGEYALAAGPFTFYGDPELLREVADALRE